MTLSIVILAAGQGKRMYSEQPKVLHSLAGKALLEHVVTTAAQLGAPIVVYGHQGDMVRDSLSKLNVTWAHQSQQLGTGHAVLQALPHISDQHQVLVLYGDVPLINIETLKNLIASTPKNALGIITANLQNPTGFGRIIRDKHDKIINIIEEKDLTEEERATQEINSGIYLFPENFLQKTLPNLQNKNAQQEYYLTDVIKMAVQENITIHSTQPATTDEVLGVNDRVQLAYLERSYQRQYAEKLMRQGVTLMDPNRFDLRGELNVGRDVTIDINVIMEGKVKIGNGCVIGPNSILRNVTLGDHVEIKANSVIEDAEIGAECVVGPFARIRPGTVIAAHAHIGNFVEIKKSIIGEASKVNHLTYIGDSEIGHHTNIGAGTITCNYDGANKYKTTIGNNAFVGSNSSLVAPVTIGDGAYIASGSTITKDAPPEQLTVCRSREQRSIPNWRKPKKKES